MLGQTPFSNSQKMWHGFTNPQERDVMEILVHTTEVRGPASERAFQGFNEDTRILHGLGSETLGGGGRRTEEGDAEWWRTGKWIDVDCAHEVGSRLVAERALHEVNSVEAGM